MSIKFFSNNLVDEAVLTASSTNAQYPVSNLNDHRRTKVYRSTSNSDYIIIDLGTVESINSFAIADNWNDGFGINSLVLEGNNTSDFTSPAYTNSITLDIDNGIGIEQFASQSYRFWRLNMTSTLGYCEVANIFLGTATEITTNGVSYGWSFSEKDLSQKSFNRYGQFFADVITTRKEMSGLEFQVMDKDEIDKIFEIYDTCRMTKPFFIYFPLELDNLVNDQNRYNGMYFLAEDPSYANINSGYYNVSLSLIENK